jgi:septum formation protein
MAPAKLGLVLASASPRRSELLRNARITFKVHPAQVLEEMHPGETAMDFVRRLAREKALSVHQHFPHAVVLGADTAVVVGSVVLGKPRDAEDAVRMLRLLSGRAHQVITGVCLVGIEPLWRDSPGDAPRRFEDVRAESTEVFMSPLGEEEIRAYVATGEPMDKAGAYAIQGAASRWIYKIVGCYFNVVGLPAALVYRMLQEHRIDEAFKQE